MSTLSVEDHTRAYHHGDLKNALVEAAVAAARQGGPEAVQLRDLARRVGVSHNAGYRHFDSRDDLLAAVAARGFDELGRCMQDAMAQVPKRRDPAERARRRLRAIGKAYVRYALTQPGMFKTIWEGAHFPPPEPAAEDGPEANPYWILSQVLDELVAAGAIPQARRPRSELVAWSAVHGLSMLVLEGPLRELPEAELGRALERICDVVDAGL